MPAKPKTFRFANRVFGAVLACLIASPAIVSTVGVESAYGDAVAAQEQQGFGRYDVNARLYYAALDTQEREEYRNILDAILSYEQQVDLVHPCDPSVLEKITDSILGDQPDVFWFRDYEYQGENGLVTTVHLPSVYGERDIDQMRAELQAATNDIVAQVKGLDSFQLEKAVFDAVADRVAYVDGGIDLGQGAYAALVEGEAVCAGYSRAFQHVMLTLGVPCTYVGGYGRGEEPDPQWSSDGQIVGDEGSSDRPGWGPHAWNMIKQNGAWYNLDVTWADTEIFGREGVAYTHYNATDGEFAADHERDPICESLPECSAGFNFANTYGADRPVVSLEDAGFQVDAVVDSSDGFIEGAVNQKDELSGGSMEYIAVVYDIDEANMEQVREDALMQLAKHISRQGELSVSRQWYCYMPGVLLEKDDYVVAYE